MDEPPSYAFLLAILFDGDIAVSVSIIALAILLATSAIIAMSEAAFFSLKAGELQEFENRKSAKSRHVVQLLKRPQAVLGAMLILSSIVTAFAVAGFALFIFQFTAALYYDFVTALSVVVIITVAMCLFCIIVPKAYGARKRLTLTLRWVGFWEAVLKIIGPPSNRVISFKKRMEAMFLINHHDAAAEGLSEAFELVAESKDATADEREILKGIVNFKHLTARQVMRSRVDIAALNSALTFHELMDQVNKLGFSRMPVFTDTVDKIEGVLYIKDLLPFIDRDENFPWTKLTRPALFVPANKKVDSLLKDFQKMHVHFAIVVDEYGGTLGIITLEDVIEEIIGDINDEFDDEAGVQRKIDDNTFVFEGKTSLNDFCKALDMDSEIFDGVKGESESLGGLILELNNELPGVGKRISFEQFTFVIEAVDKRRIKRVRVHLHEHKES